MSFRGTNSISKHLRGAFDHAPDQFVVYGKSDDVPKVYLNDRLLSLPADVELLKEACENAAFGKGEETVFDEVECLFSFE